jgi:recombinational DNA repair ATPase RecF
VAPSEPGKIRNVAVVGHRGTGKTSLVEAMLFQSGATNRLGYSHTVSRLGRAYADVFVGEAAQLQRGRQRRRALAVGRGHRRGVGHSRRQRRGAARP